MTKNTIKNIIMVVAIILILALAGGWIAQTVVNKQKQNQPVTETEELNAGGMTIDNGNIESNGVSLMSAKIVTADYAANGISPQAETAYTLTASVFPYDAIDKTVDWSMDFKNKNSFWAQGKTVTDYVTLTLTSDDGLTANVECKNAFGEQIIVKCTSRDNHSAYAECTVDYVKKITDFYITVGDIKMTDDTRICMEVSDNVRGEGGNIAFHYTYSDYTIDDTFTISYQVTNHTREKDYVEYEKTGNMLGHLRINPTYFLNEIKKVAAGQTGSMNFDCMAGGYLYECMSQYIPDYGLEDFKVSPSVWRERTLNEAPSNNGFYVLFGMSFIGQHSNYFYPFKIVVDGTINSTTVESLNLSKSGFLF